MKINKEQEAALIGMILGGGSLQRTGEKNARLRLEHRAEHKEYLMWKAKLLPQLFQGRLTHLKRTHPHTKRTYSYVRYQSHSSPFLGKLRQLFYPGGRKKIPETLAKLLKTDIALAIWYFDDGYYYRRDNCAYIYLGTVSREEALIASRAIALRFGLRNKILDKREKGFAIYFSPQELKKLKSKIGKYVMPIMAYKVPS